MGYYNSIDIDKSVAEIWPAFQNFHDLSAFPNVIQSCEAVGDTPGTEPGARRILNAAFHETLLECNEDTHTIRYSIDDGPGPVAKDAVSGYVGVIRLFSVTENDATFIVWTSEWDAGEGVAEFCNPIYQALLADLKANQS